MLRVCQNFRKLVHDALAIRGQSVFEPVQRLHHTHGWPASPVQAAGRGLLEFDCKVIQFDTSAPCVRMDRDARRHRVGQS